jgi:hypothetical protein
MAAYWEASMAEKSVQKREKQRAAGKGERMAAY